MLSLEPELRLDSQGDLVSDEQIRMIDQARQIVETRRKAKLDESERIRMKDVEARRSAAVESERRYVEAQSKALVIADKASDVTKSPPPEKYLGLDKSAQANYHSKMADYKRTQQKSVPYTGPL